MTLYDWLAWYLNHIAGCYVWEDLSAMCWWGAINVPW